MDGRNRTGQLHGTIRIQRRWPSRKDGAERKHPLPHACSIVWNWTGRKAGSPDLPEHPVIWKTQRITTSVHPENITRSACQSSGSCITAGTGSLEQENLWGKADGSRSHTAFIPVIELPRIPAECLKMNSDGACAAKFFSQWTLSQRLFFAMKNSRVS